MRRHISGLALDLMSTSPAIQRNRSQSSKTADWKRRLIAFGRQPNLRPLLPVIKEVTRAGLKDLSPLMRLSDRPAIPFSALEAAAEVARAELAESDEAGVCATLLLSIISVIAWSTSGSDIYGTQVRILTPGWKIIPFACAVAGLRSHAYRAALAIIEHAHGVVQYLVARNVYGPYVAENVYGHPLLREYRALARSAINSYDNCIADLADDLRASCKIKNGFRAEFCALLWSLGLVSQAHGFAASEALPSRQLCRLLVRRSIENLDGDITQFIWLSMRDREPFDLRKHLSLFAEINRAHAPVKGDAEVQKFLMQDPNQLFARVLVRWFRDGIDIDDLELFTHALYLFVELGHGVDHRIQHLFRVIKNGPTSANHPVCSNSADDIEREMPDIIDQKEALAVFRPAVDEMTDVRGTQIYDLIEARSSTAFENGDPTEAERVFNALEQYRQAGLKFWNLVVRIPPAEPETQATLTLIAEENKLIQYARGAYFMMITGELPWHYMRYDLATEHLSRNDLMSIHNGHTQMETLTAEIDALHDRFAEAAPDYVHFRRHPVEWDELLAFVNPLGPRA